MKFKSGLMTQGSGSFGGLTISHNKGGLYVRARVIGVNPNTPRQQASRSAFGMLSILWVDTLSESQREAWRTYADNVQVIDVLGDAMNLTGLNMYVRSNQPRIQAGLPRQDTAPIIFDIGTFTDPAFAIDQAASEVDVTFTNTDDWANEDDSSMIVYGSTPKSPSINSFTGPYQLLGTIDGDAITPPTSPAAIALAQAVAVGQREFFYVRVSRADGRLSAPFRGQDDAV